jgi:hypothetical protein
VFSRSLVIGVSVLYPVRFRGPLTVTTLLYDFYNTFLLLPRLELSTPAPRYTTTTFSNSLCTAPFYLDPSNSSIMRRGGSKLQVAKVETKNGELLPRPVLLPPSVLLSRATNDTICVARDGLIRT